jgi:Mn2+/Fe2+ NRAMP family transporter
MNPSGPSLLFWIASCAVGFAAVVTIIWARRRGKEAWSRLRRRERILVRCLAIASIWCIFALLEHDRVEASWVTLTFAAFWGAYLLFSRTIDGIWSRLRRH